MRATPQQRAAKKICESLGLIDKPGFPTYAEFVNHWLPENIKEGLIQLAGGKESPDTLATFEEWYNCLIVLKSGNPTYEISQELITALRDTEIPNLPCSELKLPFEGINLDVPHGTFSSPAHDTARVLVCHVPGDSFRVVFNNGSGESGITHYVKMDINEDTTIYQSMEATKKKIFDNEMPPHLKHEVMNSFGYEDYFKADVFRFAVNTALYLTCPDADIIKDQSKIHAIHKKLQGCKKRHKRELLEKELKIEKSKKTFIVGAKFRLQKEYTAPLTSEGKKWVLDHRIRVSGHWRQQKYGPRNEKVKTIWIAPHFRGMTYAEMLERKYIVT